MPRALQVIRLVHRSQELDGAEEGIFVARHIGSFLVERFLLRPEKIHRTLVGGANIVLGRNKEAMKRTAVLEYSPALENRTFGNWFRFWDPGRCFWGSSWWSMCICLYVGFRGGARVRF